MNACQLFRKPFADVKKLSAQNSQWLPNIFFFRKHFVKVLIWARRMLFQQPCWKVFDKTSRIFPSHMKNYRKSYKLRDRKSLRKSLPHKARASLSNLTKFSRHREKSLAQSPKLLKKIKVLFKKAFIWKCSSRYLDWSFENFFDFFIAKVTKRSNQFIFLWLMKFSIEQVFAPLTIASERVRQKAANKPFKVPKRKKILFFQKIFFLKIVHWTCWMQTCQSWWKPFAKTKYKFPQFPKG